MSLTAQVWAEIAVGAGGGSGWVVRRLYPESKSEIMAGRRCLDDGLALIFEVVSRSLPLGATLPDCVGFLTLLETLVPGPGGRCRICLVLKDRRYLEIFAALGRDVCDRFLAAQDEAAGVRALLARLNTWQRFLERFGLNLLSVEEQARLFAELLLLETELVPLIGATGAVRAWRGPFGEPHDFRSHDVAIEVKAAATHDASSFRVSNLQQLEPGSARALFLVQSSLGLDASAGLCLTELVSRVRATLGVADPGAATEFDASLLEAGYLDMQAEAYRERRYVERNRRWFEVRDGFPRLTCSSVPAGILTARYSVSIATCAAFEVDSQTARKRIQMRSE